MAKIRVLFLGPILLAAGLSSALADTGVVVGDSLGVGVSMASRLRSFAKNSVSIRATGAIDQIERAEPGTTVFLSLGTNDAVGNIDGLGAGIRRIIEAAARAKVHLVWIGPPCVFKPWDKNAISLDATLKETLKGTAVTYVSMRDDRLCDRSIRAHDGVHFSMTGYHYMWNKAREAAGFTADVTAAGAEEPAKIKKTKHKPVKKRKKKFRKKKHAHESPAAPAPAAAPPPSNPPPH
jgi:hypothetical protein